MPGYLLHVGAEVKCAHPGGQATPMMPSTQVFVSGQAIVTKEGSYAVATCSHHVGNTPSPCVTATWTGGALKVKSNGNAVVLMDSPSTSTPNGTPLNPTRSQTRVKAT